MLTAFLVKTFLFFSHVEDDFMRARQTNKVSAFHVCLRVGTPSPKRGTIHATAAGLRHDRVVWPKVSKVEGDPPILQIDEKAAPQKRDQSNEMMKHGPQPKYTPSLLLLSQPKEYQHKHKDLKKTKQGGRYNMELFW